MAHLTWTQKYSLNKIFNEDVMWCDLRNLNKIFDWKLEWVTFYHLRCFSTVMIFLEIMHALIWSIHQFLRSHWPFTQSRLQNLSAVKSLPETLQVILAVSDGCDQPDVSDGSLIQPGDMWCDQDPVVPGGCSACALLTLRSLKSLLSFYCQL